MLNRFKLIIKRVCHSYMRHILNTYKIPFFKNHNKLWISIDFVNRLVIISTKTIKSIKHNVVFEVNNLCFFSWSQIINGISEPKFEPISTFSVIKYREWQPKKRNKSVVISFRKRMQPKASILVFFGFFGYLTSEK